MDRARAHAERSRRVSDDGRAFWGLLACFCVDPVIKGRPTPSEGEEEKGATGRGVELNF